MLIIFLYFYFGNDFYLCNFLVCCLMLQFLVIMLHLQHFLLIFFRLFIVIYWNAAPL